MGRVKKELRWRGVPRSLLSKEQIEERCRYFRDAGRARTKRMTTEDIRARSVANQMRVKRRIAAMSVEERKAYMARRAANLRLHRAKMSDARRCEILKYVCDYVRTRRLRDDNFRIRMNLRNRMAAALNGKNKSRSTRELLGESFLQDIASRFQVGMSFDNYGTEWEVDHVVPCCVFDLTDVRQQEACFHISNLEPMLKHMNRSKQHRVSRADFEKVLLRCPRAHADTLHEVAKKIGIKI